MKQALTPDELQNCCNLLNALHCRVWVVIAVAVAIGAIIWNPGHLLTAALILLWSRAEWDTRDLKAMTQDGPVDC